MGETLVALLVGFGITLLALLYVLSPLREEKLTNPAREREALRAQYEQILRTLWELETDWRMGKIPEEDYQALRQRYLKEGAAVGQALQEEGEVPDLEAQIEAAVRARRAQLRRKLQ
ncbi:MAG: hypothetical protein J7452_07105 [Thermoflexus sp.]|jgi:hypothetical protein|nr:hypothetical protein [Thermoflexus sp.]